MLPVALVTRIYQIIANRTHLRALQTAYTAHMHVTSSAHTMLYHFLNFRLRGRGFPVKPKPRIRYVSLFVSGLIHYSNRYRIMVSQRAGRISV